MNGGGIDGRMYRLRIHQRRVVDYTIEQSVGGKAEELVEWN